MQKENKISEFEAAIKFKISPFLLRKFTSYSPKKDGKKLKFTVENGVYFFEESDLIDFDLYLHLPWPHRADERPVIPDYIQVEIKKEAEYRCPICRTTIGELAHINPVAETYNNHPHNLIYLCPNHHTTYDFGHKFSNVEKEDVITHKRALQTFQITQWSLQGKSIDSYLYLINKIGRLIDLEETFKKLNLKVDFDSTYEDISNKVEMLSQSIEKTNQFKEFVAKSRDLSNATNFIDLKVDIENKFTDGISKNNCELCDGKGWTPYFDTCPPCNGNGKLTKEQLSSIDFSIFEFVNCKLCDGNGWTSHFDSCPPCGGNGKMTEEQSKNIDFSVYELINCELCNGNGWTNHFDTCPPCGGTGKLTI